MQTFETGRARLKVRNASGDVRVRTDDSSETTVGLVPLDDSDAARQAIQKSRVEARGNEVSVEVEGRNWSISIGGSGRPGWASGSRARTGPTSSATRPPPTSTPRGRCGRSGFGPHRATFPWPPWRVLCGLRVKLDVSSISGSIGSELEVSESSPAGEGSDVGLRVRTVSGDVKIRRAEAIR